MKTIVKEITSTRHNIKEVEDILMIVNEEFKLPVEEYNKLMIVVTEVVMNAIVHGNKLDSSKLVKLTVNYNDKEMKIKINDEGNGFDFTNLPDPTTEENLLKNTGRGIFIVKSLIDDVEYKNTGKGSEIIITVKKK